MSGNGYSKSAVVSVLEEVRKENTRLTKWVHDLQRGMYINCVYCGHRYGPADEVPTTMADALKQHIAVCEKHPMSQLIRSSVAAHILICTQLEGRGVATIDMLKDVRRLIEKSLAAAGVNELGAPLDRKFGGTST